jgi:hypothetical protein
VFAACDDQPHPSDAWLRPKLNETLYSELEQKPTQQRPMLVLLLTLDSFSRNHFYRKLEKTIKFLQDMKDSKEYEVIDFKLHNIQGAASVENMMKIMTNVTEEISHYLFFSDQDLYADYDPLWNVLRDLGFLTFAGFDDCDYRFPKELGRFPKFDIIMRNFYCAAQNHFLVDDEK